MRIIPWLPISLLLMLFSSCKGPDQPSAKGKKNVIFILTDDLDFDELNTYDAESFPCYFKDRAEGRELSNDHFTFAEPEFFTPALDKISREGVVFNQYYVASGVCTASRYTTLTGKLPHRNPYSDLKSNSEGNLAWEVFLHPEEDNIARMFSRNGYRTAYFGKWHSGFDGKVLPITPSSADDSVIYHEIQVHYPDLVHYVESQIGFDLADRLMVNNFNSGDIDWISEGVETFILDRDSEPFFIYASLPLPHGQHYSIEQISPRRNAEETSGKKAALTYNREWAISQNSARYYEERKNMATWIDSFLMNILQALENTGQLENTLIVFTSDHQTRGKMSVTEGCRVPMIMWDPSLLEPGTYDGKTGSADLIPTLMDLTDNETDGDWDGISIKPFLIGNKEAEEQAVYLSTAYFRAVVWKDFKYILNIRPGVETGFEYNNAEIFPHFNDSIQLYNLVEDVSEQHNLADDPAYREIIIEMNTLLSRKFDFNS